MQGAAARLSGGGVGGAPQSSAASDSHRPRVADVTPVTVDTTCVTPHKTPDGRHGVRRELEMLDGYFKMTERKTTLKTEFLAATATFMTLCYILAVNSRLLSESGGYCMRHGMRVRPRYDEGINQLS